MLKYKKALCPHLILEQFRLIKMHVYAHHADVCVCVHACATVNAVGSGKGAVGILAAFV